MRQYATYILRCADDSFYIGVTNNTEQRFAQHQEGIDQSCYTYTRRPVTLMHVEYFDDIRDAIAREKQLKNWSRRKKVALIEGNEALLKEHAKKKNWPLDTRLDTARKAGLLGATRDDIATSPSPRPSSPESR